MENQRIEQEERHTPQSANPAQTAADGTAGGAGGRGARSAVMRDSVETDMAPMDWKRVTFAGVGAAILTILVVYIVFKVFGIAAGVSDGGAAAGNGAFDAARGVTGWTSLALGILFTFLAALWSVRETREKHLLQGFLVGLIAAVLIVGPVIGFMGGEINGIIIATFLLTLAAGTLAGFFGK